MDPTGRGTCSAGGVKGRASTTVRFYSILTQGHPAIPLLLMHYCRNTRSTTVRSYSRKTAQWMTSLTSSRVIGGTSSACTCTTRWTCARWRRWTRSHGGPTTSPSPASSSEKGGSVRVAHTWVAGALGLLVEGLGGHPCRCYSSIAWPILPYPVYVIPTNRDSRIFALPRLPPEKGGHHVPNQQLPPGLPSIILSFPPSPHLLHIGCTWAASSI